MFLKEFFIYWGTNSWILCWRISFPGVACLTCLFLQTCVSLPYVIGNFSILSLIFLFGFISQGHIVINYLVCRGQAQFVPGFYHCLYINSQLVLWSHLSLVLSVPWATLGNMASDSPVTFSDIYIYIYIYKCVCVCVCVCVCLSYTKQYGLRQPVTFSDTYIVQIYM